MSNLAAAKLSLGGGWEAGVWEEVGERVDGAGGEDAGESVGAREGGESVEDGVGAGVGAAEGVGDGVGVAFGDGVGAAFGDGVGAAFGAGVGEAPGACAMEEAAKRPKIKKTLTMQEPIFIFTPTFREKEESLIL